MRGTAARRKAPGRFFKYRPQHGKGLRIETAIHRFHSFLPELPPPEVIVGQVTQRARKQRDAEKRKLARVLNAPDRLCELLAGAQLGQITNL